MTELEKPDTGVGALKLAAEGDLQLVIRLVEKFTVSVDQPDEYGDTGLHAAAQQGREDIVRYLLKKDANPNVTNNSGSTPLHKIVTSKHPQLGILKELMKYNADPKIRNNAGKLPEDLTIRKVLIVELLGEDAVTEELDVPKSQHGKIIGKKGETMKDIREQTGVDITVPKREDTSNSKITLFGRKEGIEKAKALIKALNGDDDEYTTVKFPLPKIKHKFVIGKGGQNIKKIREKLGVQITVPRQEDPDANILLKGDPDNITLAIKKIVKYTTSPAEKRDKDGEGRGSGDRGDQNGRPPRGVGEERRNSGDGGERSDRGGRGGRGGSRGGGRGGRNTSSPNTTNNNSNNNNDNNES